MSDNAKKAVGKVLKKQHKPNIKYIKLEKFEDISATTLSIVRDYKHDFLADIAKFASKKDNMNLECIEFAKNKIDNVATFEEFGNVVANILIEKYNLQKKEQ